jgi:hypothetical protein
MFSQIYVHHFLIMNRFFYIIFRNTKMDLAADFETDGYSSENVNTHIWQ